MSHRANGKPRRVGPEHPPLLPHRGRCRHQKSDQFSLLGRARFLKHVLLVRPDRGFTEPKNVGSFFGAQVVAPPPSDRVASLIEIG